MAAPAVFGIFRDKRGKNQSILLVPKCSEINCATFELVSALILHMSFFYPLFVPTLLLYMRVINKQNLVTDSHLSNAIAMQRVGRVVVSSV